MKVKLRRRIPTALRHPGRATGSVAETVSMKWIGSHGMDRIEAPEVGSSGDSAVRVFRHSADSKRGRSRQSAPPSVPRAFARIHRCYPAQVGLQRVLGAAGEQLVTVFDCWEEPPAYRAWAWIVGAVAIAWLGRSVATTLRGGGERLAAGFGRQQAGKLF